MTYITDMKNEPQPGDLTPRAIAVLVALRLGPLSDRQLSARIGDRNINETRVLLAAMSGGAARRQELWEANDTMIVVRTDQWYLDHDGLGWLQDHGLDAVPGATLELARRVVPRG